MSENTSPDSDSNPCCQPGKFSWNELITSNVEGSSSFYSNLFGWTTAPFGEEYILFNKGDQSVAGIMKAPAPGMPTHWLSYVTVEDVDASVAKAVGLGAQAVLEPLDIPTVGRIAVLRDPQGAGIGLFKPLPMPPAT